MVNNVRKIKNIMTPYLPTLTHTSRRDHPNIYFNNIEITQVSEHKHLGLILDSKLSFATHVIEKLQIARKGIEIIKFLSRFLQIKTLDQIYKMYVRPHLDFCDVIFHIPKKTFLPPLYKVVE